MFENAKHYLHPRILTIFFLGAAQGFPWVIISTGLTIWLKDSGVDRATIGFAGAILVAYSVNFLWSPLVDRFNLGPLGRVLGNRRAWILAMQAAIVLGCLIASTFDPVTQLRALVIACFAVALAAATQDVAIDAFRIESFEEDETDYLAAGSSAITAGWWTGYAAIGFIPLWLSDPNNLGMAWPDIYRLMALIMVGLMLAPLLAKVRPGARQERQHAVEERYAQLLAAQPPARNTALLVAIAVMIALAGWAALGSPGLSPVVAGWWGYVPLILAVEGAIVIFILRDLWSFDSGASGTGSGAPVTTFHHLLAWLVTTLIQPLKQFFIHNGLKLGLGLLLFIFLFKIGEAFLGRMSLQFYKEIGFSNTDIATWSKLTTWWVTIIFSLLGGLMNMRFGVVKGLLISGIAMSATNLLFAVIAQVGPSIPLYAFTIVVDGFATAWSTVAFVALISMLADRSFTASQYALMASLGTLGRTLLASSSGLMVDWLGGNWALFFVITSLMVIPSLILLLFLSGKLNRRGKDPEANQAAQLS
ncbi:AmpG family muropeptide MFS transporter [Gilvimarinus sp. F26214L]|uniref:AmpG family muropeptide MFS transporter n=1 Tax=Gilvimarinus sp. DZF01 TaxID=3461371 RepID=UPI0040463A61